MSLCSVMVPAALRRITRGVPRLAREILASLAAIASALPAAAQGTPDHFPAPRSGREVERWLEEAGGPASIPLPILEIHAGYLAEFESLRDGPIEEWVRDAGIEAEEREELVRASLDAVTARLAAQRQILSRIAELEDRLWVACASAAGLPESATAALQARGRLQRLNETGTDWGVEMNRWRKVPDLRTLLSAASATPAEADRIRELLHRYDAEVLRLLVERQEILIDAARERLAVLVAIYEDPERRRAGMPYRVTGPQLAELKRLQFTAVRAIESTLNDPVRTAAAFAATDLTSEEHDDFYLHFGTLGRTGRLSRRQIAEVERFQSQEILATLPQRLERLELQFRLEDLHSRPRPPGEPRSPEMVECAERFARITLPRFDVTDLQRLVALARITGVEPLCEVLAAYSQQQCTGRSYSAGFGRVLLAAMESDSPRDEDLPALFRRDAQTRPPVWRAIDEATLETMLKDLGAAVEVRDVVRQLRVDLDRELAGILTEVNARLARPDDPERSPIFLSRFEDRDRAELAIVDAGLAAALDADAAFFDDLESLLGDGATARLHPWRATRRDRLLATTDADRWSVFEELDGVGFDREFAAIDLFRTAISSAPEALREPKVRSGFAAQAEASAELRQERWKSLLSLARDPSMSQKEYRESGGRQKLDDARIEWCRRISNEVRDAWPNLAIHLGPEAAAFRRTVLLEGYARVLGGMPGRRALAAAFDRARIAGDTARIAELESISAAYERASNRLLDRLMAAEAGIRRERRSKPPDEPGDYRWDTLLERAAACVEFRHAELDFATVRRLGDR